MTAPIEQIPTEKKTTVDLYWNAHTVLRDSIQTREDSIDRIKWRNETNYPCCSQLMDYDNEHDDQTVLDYGCGPGDDLIGFLLKNRLKKIIGIDVSEKALAQLQGRLKLHEHECDTSKTKLIRTSNTVTEIPLASGSVDFINCAGVLHHTNNPEALLGEFFRVLKPGGHAKIMVYNFESLWVHLFFAYVILILKKGMFRGIDLSKFSFVEGLTKTTDGLDCPIARVYKPSEFITMATQAGFSVDFDGGYFTQKDLNIWIDDPSTPINWQTLRDQALSNSVLDAEHKDFLKKVSVNKEGQPLYNDKLAGFSAVYTLDKTNSQRL